MEGQVEPLSNGARFRISVCLKRIFSDLRARCYVTVPADQQVRWLNRRLHKLFSLPRDTCISLVCRGHLLPSDEPLTLLEPDDLVEVFPLDKEGNDVEKIPSSETSAKQKGEKGSHEGVREVILYPEHNAHSPGPSPSSPTLKSSNMEVVVIPGVRQDQSSAPHNLGFIPHKGLQNDKGTVLLDYKKFKSQQKRKRIEYLYDETSEELPSSMRRRSSRHSIIPMPDINVGRSSESLQKRQRLSESHGEVRNISPVSPELCQTLEQLSDCDASKLPKMSQDTTQHYITATQELNVNDNSESQQKQNREEYFRNEVSNTSLPQAPSASSSSSTPDHSADYYVTNLHERKRKSRQQSTNINKTAKDCTREVSIVNNTTDSELPREHKKVEYQHHKKKKQSHHEREKRRKKKHCEVELTNEYGSGTQNLQNKCYSPNTDYSQKQSRVMCPGDDMRKMVSPISQLTQSATILPQPAIFSEMPIARQESQKLIDKCLIPYPNVPMQKEQYETHDTVTSKLPDLNTNQNSFVEVSEASPPVQSNTPSPSSPPEQTAHYAASKIENRESRQVIDGLTTCLLSPTSKAQLKDSNEIKPDSNIETSNIHIDINAKSQPIRDQEKCLSNVASKVSSPISWRTASSKPQSSNKLEELNEVKQRALQLLNTFGAETMSPDLQGLARKRRRRVRRRRKPPQLDTFSAIPSTLPVADQCDNSLTSAADQCKISTASVENQCELSTIPAADQCEPATALVVEQQRNNSPTASSSEYRRCERVSPPKAVVIRNSSVGARAPRVVRSLSPVTIDNEDELNIDRPPVWLKKVNFV